MSNRRLVSYCTYVQSGGNSRMDQLKRRLKKDPGARLLEERGSTGATRGQSESENGHYEGPLGQRRRSPVRVDERAGIPLHVLGKLQCRASGM